MLQNEIKRKQLYFLFVKPNQILNWNTFYNISFEKLVEWKFLRN